MVFIVTKARLLLASDATDNNELLWQCPLTDLLSLHVTDDREEGSSSSAHRLADARDVTIVMDAPPRGSRTIGLHKAKSNSSLVLYNGPFTASQKELPPLQNQKRQGTVYSVYSRTPTLEVLYIPSGVTVGTRDSERGRGERRDRGGRSHKASGLRLAKQVRLISSS